MATSTEFTVERNGQTVRFLHHAGTVGEDLPDIQQVSDFTHHRYTERVYPLQDFLLSGVHVQAGTSGLALQAKRVWSEVARDAANDGNWALGIDEDGKDEPMTYEEQMDRLHDVGLAAAIETERRMREVGVGDWTEEDEVECHKSELRYQGAGQFQEYEKAAEKADLNQAADEHAMRDMGY